MSLLTQHVRAKNLVTADSQSVKGQAQPPASKQSEINFDQFGSKPSDIKDSPHKRKDEPINSACPGQ